MARFLETCLKPYKKNGIDTWTRINRQGHMTFIEKQKSIQWEGPLSLFLALLAIGALIFAIQKSSSPSLDRPLSDFVSDVTIVDHNNLVLSSGSLKKIQSKRLPTNAYKAIVQFQVEQLAEALGEDKELYLFPLLSPTRIAYGGSQSQEFGDYESNTAPPSQDAIVTNPFHDRGERFVLEYLLSSLTEDHFILFTSSGIAESHAIVVYKFFNSLLSMHGFLGLGCVFLVLASIILITWINFGRELLFLFLGLTVLAMAWISFYFSRILSGLNFLNEISFAVYLILPALASRSSYYWANTPWIKKVLLWTSNIFFFFSIIQILSGIFLSLHDTVQLYRFFIACSLLSWVVLPWTMALDAGGHKYLKSNYSKQAFPIAYVIMAIGQCNDILRVFFRTDISHNVAPYLWLIAVGILCGALTYDIYAKHQQTLVDERTLAIAETTQMVVHDVRKPFHQLESLLKLLSHYQDPDSIKEFAVKQSNEIRRSMNHVNTMLNDILEGSKGSPQPIVQSISPESIIQKSLEELRPCIDTDFPIHLHYQFEHQSLMVADPNKIQRVISNIVLNATQEIKQEAHVWFQIKEVKEQSFLEFKIGNSGSYIPKNEQEKLFQALYTKGKSSGTGLGLAIAKRIIEAHGGDIWCHSSALPQKVEFCFTLPKSRSAYIPRKDELPSSISKVLS